MENKLLFVNDAFLETYGYNRDEIIGKHISVIVSENNPKDIIYEIQNGTKEGGWNGELIDKRKDGTEFPIELWTSVVKDIHNSNNVAMVGVARDITERKQAEKAIDETNNKLIQAQRVARIGSWEDYLPTGELFWSDEMYNILEIKKDKNVVLSEVLDIFPPEETEKLNSAINEAIENKKPYRMDYKIITRNGRVKYIHDEAEIKYDESGKAIWMYGTTQDITENKLAEIAIKENEERYRNIFDNAPIGMFHSTIDGKVINLNPGFVKMLGYETEEELSNLINNIGTAELVYVKPDKRAFYMEKVRQTGSWYTFENQYKRKDGGIITAVTTMRSFLNSINGQMEFEGFVTNITERKKVEENLRKSEERFKQVAESADEWIWEINANGLYTYASPIVEKILGYKPEEIVNKKYFYDFFLPDIRENIKKAAFEIFSRKEKIKSLINENLHKSGKITILETNGVPVLDGENNLLGYRGVD